MAAGHSIFGVFPRSGDLVELVSAQDKPGVINMLCRVHINDKKDEKEWEATLATILRAVKRVPKATCHLCKSYFLKGDRMVFGWSLQFKHNTPRIFVNVLHRAFTNPVGPATASQVTAGGGKPKDVSVGSRSGNPPNIEEIPLKGGIPPTAFSKGKGAFPVRDGVDE